MKTKKEKITPTRNTRWWNSRINKISEFEFEVSQEIYNQVYTHKVSKGIAIENVSKEVDSGSLKHFNESFSKDIFYGHKTHQIEWILSKWPGKNTKEKWQYLKFCFENLNTTQIRDDRQRQLKYIRLQEAQGNHFEAGKARKMLFGQDTKAITALAEDLTVDMNKHIDERVESLDSRIEEIKEMVEEEIKLNKEKYNDFETVKSIKEGFEESFENFINDLYNADFFHTTITGTGISTVGYFLRELGFKGTLTLGKTTEGRISLQTTHSEAVNEKEHMESLKFLIIFEQIKNEFFFQHQDLHDSYIDVFQKINDVVEPIKNSGENKEINKTGTGMDDIQAKIDWLSTFLNKEITVQKNRVLRQEDSNITGPKLNNIDIKGLKENDTLDPQEAVITLSNAAMLLPLTFSVIDDLVHLIKGNLLQYKIDDNHFVSFNGEEFEIKKLNKREWNKDSKKMTKKIENLQNLYHVDYEFEDGVKVKQYKIGKKRDFADTSFSYDENIDWIEKSKSSVMDTFRLFWNRYTQYLRDKNKNDFKIFEEEMIKQQIEDDKKEGSSPSVYKKRRKI